MELTRENIKKLQEELLKDLVKLAKKYDINFVWGSVLANLETETSHFIGGTATKDEKGLSKYDQLDIFEASARLYQAYREEMKRRLDNLT